MARCELHSVAEVKGQEILLTVNSLNEFDSKITGVDWRHKIENQRGAVGYNTTLIPNPSPQVVHKVAQRSSPQVTVLHTGSIYLKTAEVWVHC